MLSTQMRQMANTTNSQVFTKYILDMRDCNKTDIEAFREYYLTNVKLDDNAPIARDKSLTKVVTLGTSNDSELYSRFTEWLSRTINMYLFQLTQKDLNTSILAK